VLAEHVHRAGIIELPKRGPECRTGTSKRATDSSQPPY
jgi:hypothetical protein